MPTLNQYALAGLLAALPFAAAQAPPTGAPDGASDKQGDESMAKYAEWYSNDYDCVINCMQVFNGVTSRDRNATLDISWLTCVLEACDKTCRAQNVYQGTYIAEMFYDTGSIYECDGKPCEPQGASAAPTGAGPGSGADEGSGPGVATGPGGDDHLASSAVSMPGLKTSTAIETATASTSEPAATDSAAAGDGSSGAGRVDWSLGMGVAAAMAWAAAAVL